MHNKFFILSIILIQLIYRIEPNHFNEINYREVIRLEGSYNNFQLIIKFH